MKMESCGRKIGEFDCCTAVEGDAKSLLPRLSSVDTIITDPPYGMNLQPQRATGQFKGIEILGDKDLSWVPVVFPQFYRVLPPDSGCFVFCSHHSLPDFVPTAKEVGFEIKNCLCWDKMWFGMGGNWRPNFELVLVLTKGRFVTKSHNKTNILSYRRVTPSKMTHVTEKPVALLEELITEPDYEPQSVLDPFCGSGSTLVAAKKLGRHFLGIEIEPKYVAIARQRLAETPWHPSIKGTE